MKIKQNLYKFYYILLGIFLFTQTIYTLYKTSSLVAQSRHQKELKISQIQLINQKQKLEKELAINTSLALFTEEKELNGFEAISQPIVIKTQTSLASLN